MTASDELHFDVHSAIVQTATVARDDHGDVTVTFSPPRHTENPWMYGDTEFVWDADTDTDYAFGQSGVANRIDETFGDERNGPPILPDEAYRLALEVVVGDLEDLERATKALRGLRWIHEYIEPDDPDGGPSAADTCDELYSLLVSLGWPVP